MTPAELEALADSLGTPVFWAGARTAAQLEVTRSRDGAVYVRYLPTTASIGTAQRFLTVVTYPRADALVEVERAAAEPRAVRFHVGIGGVAVVDPTRPKNVYLAFPGGGAQIEVFSPTPGAARRLAEAGAIVPLGDRAPGTAPPFLATAKELVAFARSLPEKAYWAGPRPASRYELTRTSDGSVFVRYLDRTAEAGDPRADFLTVATYPRPGALPELETAAKKSGSVSIPLPGGGLAVYDVQTPTNVHLAFDHEPLQIEVYAPAGTDVPGLVRSGRVVPIG